MVTSHRSPPRCHVLSYNHYYTAVQLIYATASDDDALIYDNFGPQTAWVEGTHVLFFKFLRCACKWEDARGAERRDEWGLSAWRGQPVCVHMYRVGNICTLRGGRERNQIKQLCTQLRSLSLSFIVACVLLFFVAHWPYACMYGSCDCMNWLPVFVLLFGRRIVAFINKAMVMYSQQMCGLLLLRR